MGKRTIAAGSEHIGHGDRSGWWAAWVAAVGDDRCFQEGVEGAGEQGFPFAGLDRQGG
jgi:hypothetical protein